TSVKNSIDKALEEFLSKRLPVVFPPIAFFLNAELIKSVKALMLEEILTILPELLENLTKDAEKNFDVKKIVEEKVENFSSAQVENLLYAIMKKEFKFIELIGGVIGFLIGLCQVAIIKWLPIIEAAAK